MRSLGYMKSKPTSSEERAQPQLILPPLEPTPAPTSQSERTESRLSPVVDVKIPEYQWNFTPSRLKYLRKPLALAKIPESRTKTPIPKDKMMDLLRTNRSVWLCSYLDSSEKHLGIDTFFYAREYPGFWG